MNHNFINEYQQIFLVFYAILYGIMLSSTGGFELFHWGDFFSGGKRFLRLIMALLLINGVPAIYAGFWFDWLSGDVHRLGAWNVFGLFLISLSVFSFYRFFHFLISFNCGLKIFYTKEELGELCKKVYGEKDVKTLEEYKGLNNRLKKVGKARGQFFAVIVYFVAAFISYLRFVTPYLQNNHTDLFALFSKILTVVTKLI